MDPRRLIVNADDFGQSPGITRGIVEAFERGIVTSTSLMVRGRDTAAAVAYARAAPRLSVGLHVDLGEWRCCDGGWTPVYRVVDIDDAVAVAAEIDCQLGQFQELMGRLPTHLDFHQHMHQREPVRSAALALATRLALPLRLYSPAVQYCPRFYGQTAEGLSRPEWISADALCRIIGELPPGTSELSCHPAAAVDLETDYATERLQELAALCDPIVRAALATRHVHLCSFHDVPVTP